MDQINNHLHIFRFSVTAGDTITYSTYIIVGARSDVLASMRSIYAEGELIIIVIIIKIKLNNKSIEIIVHETSQCPTSGGLVTIYGMLIN